MTELVQITELLDVSTGEILPATVENAGRVITAARDMRSRINDVVAQATAWLAEESARQGTKTLAAGASSVVLSGGTSTEYDALELMQYLRDVGCPEDRVDDAVTTTIDYKVNRSVLRQLAGANPDYADAIERAARTVEKPMRASIKGA
jgi:hypothetical protein